ncbi:MAG: class I SAM-dependent RNA methyltransferase [Elusimicrobia bacterium]|nr:class I SAM-dependent RNA methyltransferase [Elusimicrobiota bacterium]
MRLIVTCAFGLEAVVKRELQALGFSGFSGADGRIEFPASVNDIPRINLWLRAADRVLLKLAEFPAADFDQLFDNTNRIPWENWIPREARITVLAKCVRSQLASERSCQSITKKAVVNRLLDHLRVRDLPETGEEYTIQASIIKDVAQITLDTTGPGLHKRGYRKDTGEAPLRENLAAALVLLSFYRPERLLLDPMCGSGTILIEAAMLARNIAPGLKRSFASESWAKVPAEAWEEARASARQAIIKEGELSIQGSDIDPARIEDAKANARRAGVGEDITFEVKDLKDLWIDKPSGIVISNPPYGIHVGSLKELTPLYVLLHKMFKNKDGWSLYILTADQRFPDFFKRARPDKVRKLFNGPIEAHYYQYYGKPPSPRG